MWPQTTSRSPRASAVRLPVTPAAVTPRLPPSGHRLANNGSLNAGKNGVLGNQGVAGDGNSVAYANGGDAAVVARRSSRLRATASSPEATGTTIRRWSTTTDSFNEDTNITHGDVSPVLSAVDHSEIEDVEFEFDD